MSISSSIVRKTVLGDMRVIIRKHTTPGVDDNEIVTGADIVLMVLGEATVTPDKTVIITPNTDDHSAEALGSYALEAEADKPVYTLEFLSGG